MADNWKRFKQRFNLYMNAGEMSQKSEKMKSSLLLHVSGEEGLDVYNRYKFDNVDDSMKFKKIMETIEEYCVPKSSLTVERFHFNKCIQDANETIDQYVTRLKALTKNCQ